MGFLKRFFGLEPMADEMIEPFNKAYNIKDELLKDKNKKSKSSNSGISDEIVAVITAAVHEFENDSYETPKLNIKPIDRRTGELSAYGKERIYLNLR